MSLETMLATVHVQFPPSMLFCAGLFASFFLCILTLVVESVIRSRDDGSVHVLSRTGNYQRYHHQLVSSPRHVAFASDEVHELDDHDFNSH